MSPGSANADTGHAGRLPQGDRETLMRIQDMTPNQRLLDLWIRTSPEWVKHAYLNCATVHRVMQQCALLNTSIEEMQWRVAGMLYEQRNVWRETACRLKQYEPIARL